MTKDVINPPSLGPAVGPFSRAVRIGDMLYVAGTSALSHLSGPLNERYLPPSIEEQTRLTYDNIKKVVEAAGGTMADIFKTTVLIKHDKDYATINKIRGAYFPNAGLISTAFICDLIRPDMLIEVEAQAYLPAPRRSASTRRRRTASPKRGAKARRR
ncbi:MAG: RidA family protein [Alphaproteobacteria bacterium]|nr:RidA family protein [Alphaproteobacteria bacterium]